jgi:hypothetical protein
MVRNSATIVVRCVNISIHSNYDVKTTCITVGTSNHLVASNDGAGDISARGEIYNYEEKNKSTQMLHNISWIVFVRFQY